MAVAVDVRNVIFFPGLLHLLTVTSCLLMNLDGETKTFIHLVLENCHKEASFLCNGPVSAVPRGARVRTAVGSSSRSFLLPDVLVWDPLSHFSDKILLCPSCNDKNIHEALHPIRWKDGSNDYDQPRLLYGLRNDVLLVGRVYLCSSKHQILIHDPGILCQTKENFLLPFTLFHKSGVTRELCRFCTSHISAGMTIVDVQVLWQQTLFDEYGMCFLNEKPEGSESFPSFLSKGSKVGQKVATAFYIQGYFEKEHLYQQRMCQMSALSLSADHTFKVSSNIGLWCDGKWIQLYDSLFIVMNEAGVVLSWKLCKGTGFHNVKDLLISLKVRLNNQGCLISHFYVDNCCQWRQKLNSVFDGVCVKLDPFHAIQRVTSKISKKRGNSPFQRLRAQMVQDFKLILRQPSHIGKQRTKPTPSALVIEQTIQNFLTKWKSVTYDSANILPQCAIDEIDKLLVHVQKGCLSDIGLSGGTSRNEGIHRVLNKTLKKSRIGIQFALALLGVFFYTWNEKRTTTAKDKRKIRVTPPIETHFEHLKSSQEGTNSHRFGMMSDFGSTSDYYDDVEPARA
ncbi:uncharacterized protein [Acropora muricata]|uniref:uncharacterized protein n=1 Tax=Acropora muricata TaxID=159855 RepID=UPI0034E4A624